MARFASVVVLITLISLSTGCRLDTAGSQLMPKSTTTVYGSATPINTYDVSEADLAEQVALTRQDYLQTMQLLVGYYERMGDNRKTEMARRELDTLKKVRMYDYLGDVIPGPQLKARVVSSEADSLYGEAEAIYNKAVKLIVWKQKGQLTMAADKFKQVIRLHPSSDKIDDAAFFLGVIYENFKDFQLAFNYYERAYQWDAQTPHPARFKAAFILDEYLHDKDQALDLYMKAVTAEGTRHPSWREHAQERVKELSGEATSK